jgi:hypothetical protein
MSKNEKSEPLKQDAVSGWAFHKIRFMTQEEKEKIDYEIKAKIDARNKDIGEWGCAGLLAIISFIILISVLGALL